MKKVFEPVTDTIRNTSEKINKHFYGNFSYNSKAIENLNEKVSEIMNDKGMIAPFLASSLVSLFEPENKKF